MLAFLAPTTRDEWSASRTNCFTCKENAPDNPWYAPEPGRTLVRTNIITLPWIKASDEACHLVTTDRDLSLFQIGELMRIQQVRTAADVSNVNACPQSADSAGSLSLHKVGRLHDPQATWRATPTNGNSLSPSKERHILPQKKNDGWTP